jgi:hypothetical protein
MTFLEMVDQVSELLRTRRRVSYRALQREFDLADDVLEDLKEELITVQELAIDQDGKMLVWVGEQGVGSKGQRAKSEGSPESGVQRPESERV